MEGESLPRSGHVSQLRQNWTVFEDASLAVELQNHEITEHYHGNRTRNQIIRSDVPKVKGYSKKPSFFKIGSAMLIQMAKGQLFPNP